MSGNILIHNIKQGDIAAFEKLHECYYKKLCFHSFRIVNRNDIAEELVQNVFINIWIKRESLNLPDNISSYLYRSVLNESLNYLKNQKNTLKNEVEFTDKEYSNQYHEMEFEQNEMRKKIREAINGLPHKSRKVFIMSRKHKFTYNEIAQRLNISVKGVEYHICSAIKLLKKALYSTIFLLFLLWHVNYLLLYI